MKLRRGNSKRWLMSAAQLSAGVVILAGGVTLSPVVQTARSAEALPAIPRTHGPSTREEISLQSGEKPGTIIVTTDARTLDLLLGNGRAFRYRIGVGREGFGWAGVMRIGLKAEWPFWRPPSEMRTRDPTLPEVVPPGPLNPLGARALYLYNDNKDSLYRIHGTNDVTSIGSDATSGCFRLTNRDVLELYDLVSVGAKVIVR